MARPSSVQCGQASSLRPSLLDLILSNVFRAFFEIFFSELFLHCSFLSLSFFLFLHNFTSDLLLSFISLYGFQRSTLEDTLPKPDRNHSALFPFPLYFLLRKEVIHPHVPVGIPCYDLTPVIGPAFDGSLLIGYATGFGRCRLPWFDGRCVQGPGTYSPRHADPRLLAIPTSWRRVAASNPNWDGFYEIRSTSLSRCSL